MSSYRVTKQRQRITKLLEHTDDFRTAQQLHDDLRDEGENIGLATVYRTLQTMSDEGELDVLRDTEGSARFRSCATQDHHHHLVCRDCGRTIEVAGPSVEEWASKIADQHGFIKVEHTLEIFGICCQCAAKRGSDE